MRRFFSLLRQSLRAVMAFKLRTAFCLISVSLGIAAISVNVASK